MRKHKWSLVALMAFFAFVAVFPSQANAAEINTRQVKKAQAHLAELGFEVGPADGIVGPMTARSMCAFELLYDLDAYLGTMNINQYRKLMITSKLRRPVNKMGRYIGISIRCQSLFQVRKHHRYARIIPVSTGKAGVDSQGRPSHATKKGNWTILWRQRGHIESNIYSGGFMEDPMFFTSGGQAIHGELSREAVLPYHASHGCVRTFLHDQKELWRMYGVGSSVIVKRSRPV